MWGGGGGDKLDFGVQGNPRAPLPPGVCVDSTGFYYYGEEGWLAEVVPGYTGELKGALSRKC